ncbi:cysteine desulfurase family protein [Sphingobacterium deserti]|uniref:cysteine desulfurase n=1 Tax=Sphingobacterium deserti TaxID=1229276 RepID=A0A0B8T688_9SPHI|nr:cysteine desulfurase family protein [Sphingobacterium deserti]KGE13439.1 cysteine desulfurase [Sphingobacterium deserti]
MSWIYLDNNATTKIDPAVLEDMLPFLQESYGNASSVQHRMGREANEAIALARHQVAFKLGCKDNEIFFTSGATEAVNTVLRGIADAYQRKGKHIITCLSEHKAVLTTCALLEKRGMEVTYLPVNQQGQLDLQLLEDSIRDDTVLVSIMAANNETGVIHPIKEIADICQRRDVLYFCDATQYIGKKELNLANIPIDILTFSAHKIHGPKGVGALFIRRKSKPIQIPALISGGKQEQGLRGGTYNVPNIIGCGKAMEISKNHAYIKVYRDLLEEQLTSRIPQCFVHAPATSRLDNTSFIAFRHIKSAELMTSMPQIALSSGSACASGLLDPSHVLKSMQVSDEDSFSSLRFSLSKYTEREEILQTVEELVATVEQVRSLSPIWKLFQDGLID